MWKIKQKELLLCFDRLLVDVENDFHPDPIKYKDIHLFKHNILKEVKIKLDAVSKRGPKVYKNYEFYHWDVPKHNYVVRHAVYIHPIDRIIFNFVLNRLAPLMEHKLSSARYSYKARYLKKKHIFGKRTINNWLDFKGDVLKFFNAHRRYKYLVSTDIAGFFEYIHIQDFKQQIYNLSSLSQPNHLVELLTVFLKKYVPSNHSGVPQNYDPSSYLTSAFLDFLDKDMLALKLNYYRYVDDIKVACVDKKDAQRVIVDIIHSLRGFNLNLSTHKTEIWLRTSDEFKTFVQDFPSIIKETDKAVSHKDKGKINRLLPKLVRNVKVMLKGSRRKFNDKLFRAYIWRIVKCHWFRGIVKVDINSVCGQCIRLIQDIPGCTDSFLRLLVLHKNRKYVQTGLYEIIKDCIYPWQEMHLWGLLIQADVIKEKKLLLVARKRFLDQSYSPAARNYALIFLGKHGNYRDRDNLSDHLRKAEHTYYTKRCLMIAVQEHQDKRKIYTDIQNSSLDLTIKSLAKYLKQRQEPEYIYEDKRVGSDRTFIS